MCFCFTVFCATFLYLISLDTGEVVFIFGTLVALYLFVYHINKMLSLFYRQKIKKLALAWPIKLLNQNYDKISNTSKFSEISISTIFLPRTASILSLSVINISTIFLPESD